MPATVRVKRNQKKKIQIPTGPLRVKVGYPNSEVGSEVIDKAIWNHYGTRKANGDVAIPARPFLKQAINSNKSKYRRMLVDIARSVFDGGSLRIELSKLGIISQGDVQKRIKTLRNPPNAPATIKAKGSANPLIDDGIMRGATTWAYDE